MKKRIKILAVAFSVCLAALAVRAEYIQVEGHKDLGDAARMQQTLKINGTDTRSIIYDRNGARITDASTNYVYIIKRSRLDMKARQLLEAADAVEGDKTNDTYAIYHTENKNQNIRESLEKNYNAYVIEAGSRYSANQPAAHLLGYLSGNKGAAGLEDRYQSRLYSEDNSTFVYTDGEGNILKGESPYVSYAEDAFLTTIDIQIQKTTEKILKNCEYNSAAVVLETETGNILAMASTPDYSPQQIENFLESNSGCLINKALQGYPPGSVFKIVTAAAALEAGADTDEMKFYCGGEESFGDVKIKCTAAHGRLNLTEAFAKSCNCAFIQLGQVAGYEAVRDMAQKMGTGTKVLGFKEEAAGRITAEQEAAGAGIANMSIGQGTLLVSPVQAARITNIIANGGIDTGIHIISEKQEKSRIISEKTADEITEMMKAVTEYGTGAGSSTLLCAGKTGSAEAGSMIHGWFTGFFPYDEPEYTITVFCEDGKSGGNSSLKVFDQIAETLR